MSKSRMNMDEEGDLHCPQESDHLEWASKTSIQLILGAT